MREQTAETIRNVFSTDSKLGGVLTGYRQRPVQADLAVAVWESATQKTSAIFEAGTGTGKTMAYLVALAEAGGKAIVSTGTKALQDQLWDKDIPQLRQLYPGQQQFSLLKGRSNYLCPERLDKNLSGRGNANTVEQAELVYVREWSSRTTSGDINEIEGHLSAATKALVTSTRDNCLGQACSKLHLCPLYLARERAQQADVLIVNHHLLLTDLLLGDEPLGRLLPTVDTVVVDEAHQLPQIATVFLGIRFSAARIRDLCFDIEREPRLTDGTIKRLRITIARQLDHVSAEIDHATSERSHLHPNQLEHLNEMDLLLGELVTTLRIHSGSGSAVQHLAQRALRLWDDLTEILDADSNGARVCWAESSSSGFVFHSDPVNASGELGKRFALSGSAWVFLSATMMVGGRFDHTLQSLGLNGIRTQYFPSPFSYSENVLGWVPELHAEPGSDEHTLELVDAVTPALPSKTLMLFTSYRALEQATHKLRLDNLVFAQGEMAKTELIERFRQAEKGILLATLSFWEGVDLRGAGVEMLVIDKIPFLNPDDPMLVAQSSSRNMDGFRQISLPHAMVMLRQGFGRLIRQEQDRGVFVLGDTRVYSRAYGTEILACLPQFNWTRDIEEVVEFIQNE